MRRWFWATLLVTILTALPVLADQPSRPLTVAELDRLGPETWRPLRVDLASGSMDLAPVAADLAQHVRALPARIPSRPDAPAGKGLDHGRQPIPAHDQRTAGPMGTGPLRSPATGCRSGGPRTLSASGRQRDWRGGPVLRHRRRNVGRGQAGAPLPCHAGIWTMAGARRSSPTNRGRPAWIGHTVPASPSDGSCGRCKRSSTPDCTPTAGTLRKPSSTMPGSRLRLCSCGSDKPPSCSDYPGNDSMDQADPSQCALRRRQIPALKETMVPARRLAESGRIDWLRDPADWFEFRMPNSYRVVREQVAQARPEGGWSLPATATDRQGFWATFEFPEQLVGWPCFTIDAPAGTIVEVLTQESHAPDGPAWLDTHFFAWTRFVCREGVNRFESFDYESLRWLQLHVRNASRPVTIRDVGVRRRQFAWPNEPHIRCSEPALQRLFDAAVNTLRNSAQEMCADGMGRERQQYSGDGGHQLHAIRYAFGETRLPARFLRTFSEGMTPRGLLPRLLAGLRSPGPGDAEADRRGLLGAAAGPRHRLQLRLLAPLDADRRPGGAPRALSPAAAIRQVPGVDPRARTGCCRSSTSACPPCGSTTIAYRQQRHKQCAFNLYAAAMLQHALAPIARAFGDDQRAREAEQAGRRDPPGHGAALLERGAGPVRQQSALAAGGEDAPAVRPLPGHGDPLRPVPRGEHRRGGAGPGGMSARDGPVVSVQRQLAVLGLGEGRPRRGDRARLPPALGHHAVGGREQHDPRGLGRPARFDLRVEPLRPVADLRADDGHRGHPSHGAGICALPGPPAAGRSGAAGTDGLRSDRPLRVHVRARAGGAQGCLDGAAAGRRRTAPAARLEDRSGAAHARSSARA